MISEDVEYRVQLSQTTFIVHFVTLYTTIQNFGIGTIF